MNANSNETLVRQVVDDGDLAPLGHDPYSFEG